MVIQIAGGIVLAILILMALPYILFGAILVVIILLPTLGGHILGLFLEGLFGLPMNSGLSWVLTFTGFVLGLILAQGFKNN